jgi:hypothetical protein
MPWVNAVVARESEELLQGLLHLGKGSAGKVGSPDRACEEEIPHKESIACGKDDAPWGVPWDVDDTKVPGNLVLSSPSSM